MKPPIAHSAGTNFLHGLTISTGYRVYNSYKHYIGTVYQVQRQINHNAVVNHVNLFEMDLNYQVTPRLSVIATIPALEATRHGQSSPLNVYHSGGIGDVTVGVQSWVWRPPTESHGNVAISAQLKLPTGINDAKGTTIAKSGTSSRQSRSMSRSSRATAPGDSALAPRLTANCTGTPRAYFTGSWLFSPQDTTGVLTFRPAPGENVVSATDQYLWRGGFSRPVTGVKPSARPCAQHWRPHGRRAGARCIWIKQRIPQAGLRYLHRAGNDVRTWTLGPVRERSVGDGAESQDQRDRLENHTHGDAAFADYTVIAGMSRTF